MNIEIKVDLGYDEKRDQFYLADFEVVKSDTPTGKAYNGKRDRQPRLSPSTKQNGCD